MKKLLKGIFQFVFYVAIGVGIGALVNPTSMFDVFRRVGYTPEGAILEIEEDLDLTDAGKGIFEATHPTLDDRESFNRNCESHDSEVTVLGCYGDSTIHVYNVETDELPGIIESTAAHELLHAIWGRMSFLEQYLLSQEIEAFYKDNVEELSVELEHYSEESRIDELHSRIGTEFKELPEALEKHYAKYFRDQDAVVDYYKDYESKFRELSEEIKELDAEIDELKPVIDEMKETYHNRQTDLNSRIDQFNACARTENCFTEAQFQSGRRALVDEQAEIEDYYNELNEIIARYNALIDEYNDNVLHSRTLEDAINSNSEGEDVEGGDSGDSGDSGDAGEAEEKS